MWTKPKGLQTGTKSDRELGARYEPIPMKYKGPGSKAAALAQNTIGIVGMSDCAINSVMPKYQNAYQPHFVDQYCLNSSDVNVCIIYSDKPLTKQIHFTS